MYPVKGVRKNLNAEAIVGALNTHLFFPWTSTRLASALSA